MGKADRDRGKRHNQTPLIRAQINALRKMLEDAQPEEIGAVLATNIIAGFALELSLKLFYMTFFDKGPKFTHDLRDLWSGLPSKWRREVDREYRRDARSKKDFSIFALQSAPSLPNVPDNHKLPSVGTADELFTAVSVMFTDARYFFKKN